MPRDVLHGEFEISKTRDTKGKGGDGRGTEQLPEPWWHQNMAQLRLSQHLSAQDATQRQHT